MKKSIKISIVFTFLLIAVYCIYTAYGQKKPYTDERQEKENTIAQYASELPQNPLDREIDFKSLQAVNPEIVGWISVPGTEIDYQVCLTTNNDFYLSHDSFKNKSSLGAIYAATGSSENLQNAYTILFGHNMTSGQMFGDLTNYSHWEFCKQYPNIYLYSPGMAQAFTIYSVYVTQPNSETYTQGYSLGTDAYGVFLSNISSEQLYDCGIVTDENKPTMALSTCTDRGWKSERFVVQGIETERKVGEINEDH